MQRASELRHRVTIQQKLIERDENNYPLPEVWIDHVKLWAKVTPLSAKDLLAAQAGQGKTVARMKIRYREDIDTTMRVIHKGRIYAIDSPPLDDPNSSYEYVTLLLSNGTEKDNPDAEWDSLVGSNQDDVRYIADTVEQIANKVLPQTLK
jgi:SPP1 family predicted phage head-tail adaptor